jgi:ABC-type glycerol-3-phosphate transport system substrate-binding protein
MGFRVLFYRKDIVNELGIKLPNTWDEFYKHVLPVLNQHRMEFYFPLDITTFLFQKGGSFYNEEGTKSALDSPEAYQAFKEMSELYMSYGLPVSANFYNRIRSGEMPMGIEGYNTYMLLSVAAPELAGRWGIAPIPGTLKDDGTIDRSSGGVAGEAIVIMNQSSKKEESWEFLKWWTSTEVQSQFGRELEALVGVQARWNTANIEAFLSLPWNAEDLKVLEEQWKWYREMPVVLGGYFTQRHITNAWNRIIISGMPVRDSVEKAFKDINRELKAKQQEYGIFIDE